jgi:hypothetical protein
VTLCRTLLLAEEGRAGNAAAASTSERPAAEPPARSQKPRRAQPRSRFFFGGGRGSGGGFFAESLAREATGVLVNSGFGAQLLSLFLGECGVGLSHGKHLPHMSSIAIARDRRLV